MKQFKLIISICVLFTLVSFLPIERKDFVVEISFIDWLDEPFVKYTLDKNFIKVETSGYEDFKIVKSLLYKRRISAKTSDSIYNYLASLKIDTVKANCNNLVLDGLYKTFYFEGYGLGQTIIKTHSCITSDAAKLQRLVEGQIKNVKFKYGNFKEAD
jgi:hypothetical protein